MGHLTDRPLLFQHVSPLLLYAKTDIKGCCQSHTVTGMPKLRMQTVSRINFMTIGLQAGQTVEVGTGQGRRPTDIEPSPCCRCLQLLPGSVTEHPSCRAAQKGIKVAAGPQGHRRVRAP